MVKVLLYKIYRIKVKAKYSYFINIILGKIIIQNIGNSKSISEVRVNQMFS